MTFIQLKKAILLAPLPYGARARVSWWSNTLDRRMAWNRAWLDAGWRVASVDRTAEMVTFERFDPAF